MSSSTTSSSSPSKQEAQDSVNDDSQQETSGSLLKQTLLSQDECFVYKLPKSAASSSGYRADDWNLAQPLQTCGLQVERRNNELFLLFTLEQHTKLFCLSKYVPPHSLEAVQDSSRYFVTQIEAGNGKSARIGFGFRDRDVALDLLQCLNGFKASLQREMEAKALLDKAQALAGAHSLQEGQKIHISLKNTTKKKSTSDTAATSKPKTSASNTGGFLLKKPPSYNIPLPADMNEDEEVAENVAKLSLSSKAEPAASENTPNTNPADGNDDFDDDDDFGDFQGA